VPRSFWRERLGQRGAESGRVDALVQDARSAACRSVNHLDIFDTEEVTGSNPVSPTKKPQVESPIVEIDNRALDRLTVV
jgi:hypothetical protein